jgi:hypothetical protein
MSTNFRDALNGPNDDLRQFDAATSREADLAAFDEATGATHIPDGWYDGKLVCGEVVTTKTNKTAYRLTIEVSDGPHRGYRLWRYFIFDTPANVNRAKAALAPLGLKTSADLRKPFPDPDRSIAMRLLVKLRERRDGSQGSNVERFEVVEDRTTMTSPSVENPVHFAGAVDETTESVLPLSFPLSPEEEFETECTQREDGAA